MLDRDKPTYNDAMAEWSAKHSFFRNPANRLIHPDPDASLGARLIGYLLRLVVLAVILGVGGYFLLMKQLKGRDFRTETALNLTEILKASEEDLKYGGIRWTGGLGHVSKYVAQGSEDAFFHNIELNAIEFRASLPGLLGSKWQFSKITIDEMKLQLRSGGRVEVDSLSSLGNQIPRIVAAGFLKPEPNLADAEYEELTIHKANIFWGQSDFTRGSIIDSRMKFFPGSDKDNWRIEFEGGTLTQNWWKDLEIRTLTIRREPGKLILENGSLAIGEGGQGFLAGEVETGEIPRLNLRLEFADVPAEFLIADSLDIYFDSAIIAGTDNIGGSINLRSGVEHNLDIKFQSGTIHDFPPLDALALITEHTPFRRFPIDSGIVKAESKEGVFSLKELNIDSKINGKITGALDIEDPRAKARETQMSMLDEGSEKGNNPDSNSHEDSYQFRGELLFGVNNAIVKDSTHPLVQEHLSEKYDGFHWMRLPVNGSLSEKTNNLIREVRRGLRN
ncbi:MAG: hypothetical protein AAGA58_09090 [Verrucomicrobiota bacterium]